MVALTGVTCPPRFRTTFSWSEMVMPVAAVFSTISMQKLVPLENRGKAVALGLPP